MEGKSNKPNHSDGMAQATNSELVPVLEQSEPASQQNSVPAPKLDLSPEIAKAALGIKNIFKGVQLSLTTLLSATESTDDLMRMAGITAETPEERRARWLQWREEEEAIKVRGALVRVYERELKSNPKADRSYIGKQIKMAEKERDAEKRQGEVVTPTPNNPFGRSPVNKVIDGKHQN